MDVDVPDMSPIAMDYDQPAFINPVVSPRANIPQTLNPKP